MLSSLDFRSCQGRGRGRVYAKVGAGLSGAWAAGIGTKQQNCCQGSQGHRETTLGLAGGCGPQDDLTGSRGSPIDHEAAMLRLQQVPRGWEVRGRRHHGYSRTWEGSAGAESLKAWGAGEEHAAPVHPGQCSFGPHPGQEPPAPRAPGWGAYPPFLAAPSSRHPGCLLPAPCRAGQQSWTPVNHRLPTRAGALAVPVQEGSWVSRQLADLSSVPHPRLVASATAGRG